MIVAENAPDAIGPYSHAVCAGNTIYLSGQVPFDPKNGEVVGDCIEDQCKQTFANMNAVLQASGVTVKNIVKTTVYLSDFSNFSSFNKEYEKFMDGNRPARACVEVSSLPAGILLEMEAIAYIES